MTEPEVFLKLAEELAIAHRRSRAGRITVVPVLVDDLASARIVLEAFCELAGGRFFSSDDDDLQGAVAASADPLLTPAIEAALTTVPAGGTRRVVLQPSGTRVDAVFSDPPAGPAPSPGEKTVLAVARAAIHEDLDTCQLAVIAWRDSGVDLRLRAALWRLGVDQLSEMPHRILRTLIMLVETEIDIGLHCQPGRGFRFAIQNGRLLYRHGIDELNSCARQIAAYPGKFVLFLGAGFSASSRLPLGNTLRDQAIRRLLNIAPDAPFTSHELAKRFYDWVSPKQGWLTAEELALNSEVYIEQLTLEQVVRVEKRLYPDLPTLREFAMHHDDVIDSPGTAVRELVKILGKIAGRVILVEVNFDLLIERHYTGPMRVFASEADFEDAATYIKSYLESEVEEMPLLKLHGTIDQLETCVVSDDQTEMGVGKRKLEALRALLADDPPRLWIFIGASMRDRDLLRVFNDEDWARGVDERWVSPFLVDTVEEFAALRIPFWRKRTLQSIDDRLVSETADSFFLALGQAVNAVSK